MRKRKITESLLFPTNNHNLVHLPLCHIFGSHCCNVLLICHHARLCEVKSLPKTQGT
jgi:hypothetical protein